MRKMCSALLGLLLVLAVVVSIFGIHAAEAAVITVYSGQSIQTAINASHNGDVIIVSPGTYIENIRFNGKAVTVKSTNPNNPSAVSSTIIDGGGTGSVVSFISGEGPGSVLNGFTLTNGTGTGSTQPKGGGIYCLYSSPTIANCIITGNSASYEGGGIFGQSSSPDITNCTITGNHAGSGAGMFFTAPSQIISFSYPRLTNCTVAENEADGNGGGIYIQRGDLNITGSSISNNTSGYSGGGIIVSAAAIHMSDSTITGNSTVNSAAGLTIYFDLEIDGQLLASRIINCNISNNDGGGIEITSQESVTEIINCVVAFNISGNGGGLSCSNASPSIINSTLYGNKATSGWGGAINSLQSSLSITNSILWGNSPTEIYVNPYYPEKVPVVSHSIVMGGYPGVGNIDSDPLFVNQGVGDFHLQWGSPAIDAGLATGAPGMDIEGTARPQDGDGTQVAEYDLGAYEAGPYIPEPSRKVLFISNTLLDGQEKELLFPWEVEYVFRLEQAGYQVVLKSSDEFLTAPDMDLTRYCFVYCDFGGGDQFPDILIDLLIGQAVPFMTSDSAFAYKWGLGKSLHQDFLFSEWLTDQTEITILAPWHDIFMADPDYIFEGTVPVYRTGGDIPFTSVLADDETLSPDAVKLASTYDSVNAVDELSIVGFPPGSMQNGLSNGHGAPTAPVIHLGMGNEVPDIHPFSNEPSPFPGNDHENFWTIFINAANFISQCPGEQQQDAIPPTTSVSLAGQAGNNGWYRSNVTVTLTAVDNPGGSDVAQTFYSLDGASWVIYSTPFTVAAEGATTVRYYSVDNASLSEAVQQVEVSIDKTPPTVVTIGVADGAEYIFGEVPAPGYEVYDNVSGVEYSTTVISGDTVTGLGDFIYTVTARDKAGHTTVKQAAYKVVYGFGGFLAPVSLDKPFKLGRTIPVKFQLTDAAGNYVPSAAATITIRQISGDEPTGEVIEASSTSGADTGNNFRYDPVENQYIYNLNTKSLDIGKWQISVSISDGTVRTTTLYLK